MASKGARVPLGLLILSIWGCGGVTPSTSPASSPLFSPTIEDTTRLAPMRHELDRRASRCVDASSCEEVHFARALVSLFENQEAACASFQYVIDHSPASPLAASSKLWLELVGKEEAVSGLTNDQRRISLSELVAQFVRDWLERHLSEQVKPEALTTAQDSTVEQTRVTQGLQKQLRERDRQIAVLRSQLEALKQIDQDHEEMKRTLKRPATLLPMTDR
jgi:hypothetical protein